MGVRTFEAGAEHPPPRLPGPGVGSVLAVGGIATLLLLANGRPIGEPATDGLAGAVLQVVLWPLGLLLELDPTGRAVVGKVLAALCAGGAAAALFAAVTHRHPDRDARASGIVLAVGTSLAAASQAWSGEAPATAAVAVAVLLLTRASTDDDPGPAARAAVPLALAVLLEPTTWALALVLVAAALVRWWRSAPRLLAWILPAALVALAFGTVGPSAPAGGGSGVVSLLLSPVRGALVFAPVVLVGLAGLARAVRPPRGRHRWDQTGPPAWLPLTAAVGLAAHVAVVAFDGGGTTNSGPFWGPRLLAPAWPLLLLFLPEGLALLRLAGAALVALSVAVQALGAFSYDGRWDRLHRGGPGSEWDLMASPVAFQVRGRVVRPAVFAVQGRRLVVREHPLVLGGPTGSLVVFLEDRAVVTGADSTLGDVVLEGGARVRGDRLRLAASDGALFLRVRDAARTRRLELRIKGRGSGTLAVGEKTFWTAMRWSEHPVRGPFRVRVPYSYAESGGGDVRVISRGSGTLEIESVALVPPGEPEDVIRLD